MKKLKSAFFVLLTMASIFSYLFLQNQRAENPISNLHQVEESEAQEAANPTLPDAEILKHLVNKGKKYISTSIH